MSEPLPHPVAALLQRTALDGSTCLPAAVLTAALPESGLDVCDLSPDGLVPHPHWGSLEVRIAAAVSALAGRGASQALRLVVAPRGTAARDLSTRAVVVEAAHTLGLETALELFEGLAAEPPGLVVLVGDPALPYAPGPGRVFADLVASGVLPVETGAVVDDGPLARLVQALRDGQLPPIDAEQREVVVTAAADAGAAVRRAVQLVTTSVPREFDIGPHDTLVVTTRVDGAVGAAALRAALDAAGASAVRTATESEPAEAVVLVLAAESAGSITRSLLVGAATHAARHLSVVHQAGPALAEAVTHRPHRPRRTRLAALLAASLT
ncbi:MAG: hypothetical protein H0U77_07505 [Nocardioidaceae bacterium]|nr:hypothetical protein [Nocardioidaceae bacterium]